jgi:phosphoribosyl 1,2-cyclic phosphodiesterase
MRLTFCGVRGSTPAPGAAYVRYGGHTSCLAISSGEQPPRLVLDAGTGIRNVTSLLDGNPYDGTILLGHLHWDHTQGLPFFAGGGAAGSRVHVGLPAQGEDAEPLLARFMSPPHFPIAPGQLGPGWSFSTVEPGMHTVEGYAVLAAEIPHKGGRAFGYRVSDATSSVAYLSDHSPTALGGGQLGHGALHPSALALADNVDVLVHDAQHLFSELAPVEYLGHACVEYAVDLAAAAGARAVALFHHGPNRTDEEIDAVLAVTREYASSVAPELVVLAAAEGHTMDL